MGVLSQRICRKCLEKLVRYGGSRGVEIWQEN